MQGPSLTVGFIEQETVLSTWEAIALVAEYTGRKLSRIGTVFLPRAHGHVADYFAAERVKTSDDRAVVIEVFWKN